MPDAIKTPNIKNPKPPEMIARSDKPEGWWDLRDITGTREGVTKSINASDIPSHAKVYLLAELATIPAEFNFIELDAHRFMQYHKLDLHMTISPSKALV